MTPSFRFRQCRKNLVLSKAVECSQEQSDLGDSRPPTPHVVTPCLFLTEMDLSSPANCDSNLLPHRRSPRAPPHLIVLIHHPQVFVPFLARPRRRHELHLVSHGSIHAANRKTGCKHQLAPMLAHRLLSQKEALPSLATPFPKELYCTNSFASIDGGGNTSEQRPTCETRKAGPESPCKKSLAP